MKTKEAKDLAKKPVRKRVRKKPVVKKVKPVVAAEPKVEVKEPLTNVEKVQVILIVSILAALFYFGT
jgi:hypothetical protein